jgi:hypothetical protein
MTHVVNVEVCDTFKHLPKQSLDAVLAEAIRVGNLIENLLAFNILEYLENLVFILVIEELDAPHDVAMVQAFQDVEFLFVGFYFLVVVTAHHLHCVRLGVVLIVLHSVHFEWSGRFQI